MPPGSADHFQQANHNELRNELAISRHLLTLFTRFIPLEKQLSKCKSFLKKQRCLIHF